MTGIIAALPFYAQPKWETIKGDLATGVETPFATFAGVNSYVNRIPYRSDEQAYGVTDRWSRPAEFFARLQGDCEDYAIAKLALCRENNLIQHRQEALVLCWDFRRDVAHMVFAVDEMIFDNQRPDVVTAALAMYKFLGKVKL